VKKRDKDASMSKSENAVRLHFDLVFSENVEAARPIPGARSRRQISESRHGSQSTAGGDRVERAGLIGRRWSRAGPGGRSLGKAPVRVVASCRRIGVGSMAGAVAIDRGSCGVPGCGGIGRRIGAGVRKSLAYRGARAPLPAGARVDHEVDG
jgi:hypothetical protein